MKQCPACGANNSSDQPSCSICGASLSQVADSGAARTLFGMPALKFGEAEAEPEPEPERAPTPAPAPAATDRRSPGPGTRPGFRALDAVELDNSVGSVNMRVRDPGEPLAGPTVETPAPDESIRSTQFGAPSPFKAGQLPPIGTGDVEPEPEPVPEPAITPIGSITPAADIMSTQFGAPSPTAGAPDAAGQPEPAAQPDAAGDQQYRTLVGPPLPLAEAARARKAAKARAEQEAAEQAQAARQAQQDNYRTLVGPPVPIAEAARARDAARARRSPAEQRAAQRAAEARGPSIIVSDGLSNAGQASVIVDEPVTPRRTERPAADAQPRTGRATGAAEVNRGSNDDERAAASRFAAAMDTDERTAMVVTVSDRSYGKWIFLLLIVVGIALALWLTRDAQAFQANLGAIEVGAEAQRLILTADVSADRPVKVSLAGDPTPPTVVDGTGRVQYALPLAGLEPGQRGLALDVVSDDGEMALPVELTVWLQAEIGPVQGVGEPAPIALAVRPGWTPEAPFTASGGAGRFEAEIDPAAALAEVDQPGGLTGALRQDVVLRADGESPYSAALQLEVPLPATPLVVTAPARAWRRDADAVVVAGRTTPGALVKAGGMNALADDAGRFTLTAPLGGAREQTLEVVADGPGARPTVERVTVERLTPAGAVAQAAALRARQNERLGTVGRTPSYARWSRDAEALRGRAVSFSGRLVAVERGAGGESSRARQADRAVVATCDTGDHCPVWITTHSPMLVDVGARVVVSGTLAGTETWRAPAGFVTAPRVEGALLAP